MSYRNDNGAGYDRTLLSSVRTVRDPTRAERQEGYNVDEGRDRRAPTPPPKDGPRWADHGDVTSTGGPGYVRREDPSALNGVIAKLPPWYRRRRNVIVIVVVVAVIIGAAVGGAVGGTQIHKSTSTKPTNNTGGTSGQQGTGTGSVPQPTPNASDSTASSASADMTSASLPADSSTDYYGPFPTSTSGIK